MGTTQNFNRVPGSRWNSSPKRKGKAKGTGVQRNNRGVNWTETVETNLNEENNLYSGQECGEEDFQLEEELSLEVMQTRGIVKEKVILTGKELTITGLTVMLKIM